MTSPSAGASANAYDAVLLVSFGGPEGHDEVMPFLRRVTAGRGIPDERLAAVATHYHRRGGISPINAQNRALVAALRSELERRGSRLPVLLANRNSEPFLDDVLRHQVAAGARRFLVVLTSGYSSYSSCRQYRENLADALAGLGPDREGVVLDKIGPWHGLPGFVDTMAEGVIRACEGRDPAATRVLGVTHSIPLAMNDASGPTQEQGTYVTQHRRVLAVLDERLEAASAGHAPAELVFCSRSGPPHQPWLEPDVADRIRDLAASGVTTVVLAPIGFVSDHMEVINDLDEEAVTAGREVGVDVLRVPTVGTDPRLVADLVDEVLARAAGDGERRSAAWAVPGAPPATVCPAGCCANTRGHRPAACGED